MIQREWGKHIHGQVDPSNPGIMFTKYYISRRKAMVRGAFLATARPTPLSGIRTRAGSNDGLFPGIVESLVAEGSLPGVITGDTYIPTLSQATQATTINSFFSQNGFVDFDTLRKLKIDDPAKFVKKAFPGHLLLQDRVVNKSLLEHVDAVIDDAISQNRPVNVSVMFSL